MSYKINVYEDGNPDWNVQDRWDTVRYIVVHYTANGYPDTPNAAKNNCIYFSTGYREASAHFFIDDSAIWEFADPARWNCWHVGDGHGAYGITNQNSIGIEVVQDDDAPFSDEEIDKLSWLVKDLMKRFEVPAENVVRHYDASRKLCPWYYTEGGSGGDAAWDDLHRRITTQEKPRHIVEDLGKDAVYRMFNGYVHLWTKSRDEAQALSDIGWSDEGLGWRVETSGDKVRRLYNPYNGQHMLTASDTEAIELIGIGWKLESLEAMRSKGKVPVHRLLNPHTGEHFLTTSSKERDALKRSGWTDEGTGLWSK